MSNQLPRLDWDKPEGEKVEHSKGVLGSEADRAALREELKDTTHQWFQQSTQEKMETER